MRKFIINFSYKGFLFSAKVLLKRDNRQMLISTMLTNDELAFLLEDGKLMFMQQGKGFELILFKKDRTFEILKWTIQLEYVDKAQIIDAEVFSLS